MPIVCIFSLCFALLMCGYFFYGRKLEKLLIRDCEKKMPSEVLKDGVDYIPTPTPVLFGHHFSSIAGAGPIVGPIIAAAAFGWLPTLLWILIGSIFIGGVHDYAAAIASVNHHGMSIGELCRRYFDRKTYYAMLIFLLLDLSYVITVFLDLTVGTMVADGNSGTNVFCENGAVATASIIYIGIALLYGIVVHKFKVNFKSASFIFVPLVFVGIFAGYKFPIRAEYIPEFFGSPKNFWTILLVLYCFLASITPVWILLQPRDYLSSFLLYMSLVVGTAGLLISGLSGKISIEQPAFITFNHSNLGFIFPAIFITVACGAVSGFHSLVAAGTTAKQLAAKKHILPVAYGSMLVEALLAVLAVIAVMIVAKLPAGQAPTATFANALALFSESCGFGRQIGLVFGLLAISTFLLTTLDTCTRLTRFIIEEFLNFDFPAKRYIATLAALAFPTVMCFVRINNEPAWKSVWPAFGTTNQLLAAITLLIVSVWLHKDGRKTRYTLVPMIFMLICAGTSLVLLAKTRICAKDYIIGGISIVMILATVFFIVNSSLVFMAQKQSRG